MATHVTCPRCEGRGKVEWYEADVLPQGDEPFPCITCRGTGKASMLEGCPQF